MLKGEDLTPVMDALRQFPAALDFACERLDLAASLIPRDGSVVFTGIDGLDKLTEKVISHLERTIKAIKDFQEAVEQGRQR